MRPLAFCAHTISPYPASSQVIAAVARALDAIAGPCPACCPNGITGTLDAGGEELAMLECRGPFDGTEKSSGVPAGHEGFGWTFMCEYGHWYAHILGALVAPEHILTVVE